MFSFFLLNSNICVKQWTQFIKHLQNEQIIFVASVSKWTFANDKINAFSNAVYKWPILEMQYEKINTQSMKTIQIRMHIQTV